MIHVLVHAGYLWTDRQHRSLGTLVELFDTMSLTIREGPSLNIGRVQFIMTIQRISGILYRIYVVGGTGYDGSNVTEKLDIIAYGAPSNVPTSAPSHNPSNSPSFLPSFSPMLFPSSSPSFSPTNNPTRAPVIYALLKENVNFTAYIDLSEKEKAVLIKDYQMIIEDVLHGELVDSNDEFQTG